MYQRSPFETNNDLGSSFTPGSMRAASNMNETLNFSAVGGGADAAFMARAKEAMARLNAELNQERSLRMEKEAALSRLATEFDTLVAKSKKVAEERDNLADEIELLHTDFKRLEGTTQRTAKNLESEGRRFESANEDLTRARLKTENLEKEIAELRDRLDVSEAKNREKLSEIESKSAELATERTRLTLAQSELEDLKTEFERLLRKRDRDFEEMETAHQEELKKLHVLVEELALSKDELEVELVAFADEKEGLFAEIDSLKRTIADMEAEQVTWVQAADELVKCQNIIEQLRIERQDASNEVEDLKPLIDKTIVLEDCLAEADKQVGNLKLEISEGKQRQLTLEKDLSDCKRRLEAQNLELESERRARLVAEGITGDRVRAAELETRAAIAKQEQLHAELRHMESLARDNVHEAEHLKGENDDLRAELSAMQARKKELEKACLQWQKAFNKRVAELSKLQGLEEETRHLRGTVQSQTLEFERQRDEMRLQYDMLSRQLANAAEQATVAAQVAAERTIEVTASPTRGGHTTTVAVSPSRLHREAARRDTSLSVSHFTTANTLKSPSVLNVSPLVSASLRAGARISHGEQLRTQQTSRGSPHTVTVSASPRREASMGSTFHTLNANVRPYTTVGGIAVASPRENANSRVLDVNSVRGDRYGGNSTVSVTTSSPNPSRGNVNAIISTDTHSSSQQEIVIRSTTTDPIKEAEARAQALDFERRMQEEERRHKEFLMQHLPQASPVPPVSLTLTVLSPKPTADTSLSRRLGSTVSGVAAAAAAARIISPPSAAISGAGRASTAHILTAASRAAPSATQASAAPSQPSPFRRTEARQPGEIASAARAPPVSAGLPGRSTRLPPRDSSVSSHLQPAVVGNGVTVSFEPHSRF